jgi:hypothetical protein
MSLEQRLAEAITQAVDRTPAPTFELAAIRRGARRRSAMRAVALTAVVATAAGLAATQLKGDDRSVPPVDRPSSTPSTSPTAPTSASASPTEIPAVRDEQVVVTWDRPPSRPSVPTLLGRSTSDDADYAGDGEVSVRGPVHAYMQEDGFGWERYCSGAPGTWWVFTVEPQLSFLDVGRCDGSGQPTSAPPSDSLDGPMVGEPGDLPGRTTEVEVRMFLTDQDPTEYYDCMAYSPPQGCADVEPPHAVGTGARFGLAMYGREPAVPATTIFGSEVYPAARVLDTTYSFTTAVAAATGSRLLTYRLPGSTHRRIVQAMAGQEEPCRHTDGHRSPDCLPVPELRIDGQPVDNSHDFLFTTLAARAQLPPGGAHEITLEIPAADTDVLDLGFVVFEARDD